MELVRILSDEDIKALAQAADIVWHEWFEKIIGKAQVDYMLEKFQSQKAITQQINESGYEYYAVKESGRVIAYTGIKAEEKRMFLSKLYVLKDFRGRRLSSMLLEKVYERAAQQGLLKVYLTVNRNNKSSIDIYLKKGFKITAQQKADIGGGFVMDDYIMEKSL